MTRLDCLEKCSVTHSSLGSPRNKPLYPDHLPSLNIAQWLQNLVNSHGCDIFFMTYASTFPSPLLYIVII
ncbi:hypothetical protein I3842_01G055800 [Carya illinoinensis]|uniref:Uncharacterized protein n=1 Tax=Carya illinoinensis TaxID=32201 RepID=A0A922G1Y1_CARIL|nr:hypothetical protein I3842_01G055800 [Carya illinoinensis]